MKQELSILKKFIPISFLLTIFLILNSLFFTPYSYAQTFDPFSWQTGATGMKSQSNSLKKTGGLGFVITIPTPTSTPAPMYENTWPVVSIRGGIQDAGYSKAGGPIGVDLGQIKIPGQTGTLSSEKSDWSKNELTFNEGTNSQIKMTVSRLSSAILLNTSTTLLRMFSGNPYHVDYDSSGQIIWQPNPNDYYRPSYPKYVAYQSSSGINVQSLSTNDLLLTNMTQNWLLLWYGDNSHFADTKLINVYGGVPHNLTYKADAPLLLIFQNKPNIIKNSPEGGIDISFNQSPGYLSLFPLLGREMLKSSVTEGWKSNLPSEIITKINFWIARLCQYPSSVAETYNYNSQTDTASINENFTFTNICNGTSGIQVAPISPFLALAKDALAVSFSGNITDLALTTEYGPTYGIENTNSYTWRISGLKIYTDSQKILGSGNVPVEVANKLTAQVNKLIAGGHWASWIYLDHIPTSFERGDLYWANPADALYQLVEIAPAITDPTAKNYLINYIKSERFSYPPESVYDLDNYQGTVRKYYYSFDNTSSLNYSWSAASSCDNCPGKLFRMKRVSLYNFFSLAKYYELTSETPQTNIITAAETALNQDMAEQDWATMYWFFGFNKFYSYPYPVPVIDRHTEGMIGLIKLAKMTNNNNLESLGRSLLAKAVVTRIAMTKYPRYLYSANLIQLPTDPDWMPKSTAGHWFGDLFNYNWSSSNDDARQIAVLNQIRLLPYDYSAFMKAGGTWPPDPDGSGWGFAFLTAYKYLSPELARLLNDKVKLEAEISLLKSKALWPHWYSAFAEGTLGGEHNMNYPIDSYQLFNAQAWLEKDNGDNLYKYSDIPWLEAGDLFYLHKLAETIKAYKGWSWSDQPLPTQGPTATPTPSCTLGTQGDINCDRKIDILDLVSILSNFGRTGNGISGDVNGDNKVDILDLVTLLSNFGRSQ